MPHGIVAMERVLLRMVEVTIGAGGTGGRVDGRGRVLVRLTREREYRAESTARQTGLPGLSK